MLQAHHIGEKEPKDTVFTQKRNIRFPIKEGVVVRQLALSADELDVLVAFSNGRVITIDIASLEYTVIQGKVVIQLLLLIL